MQYYEFRAMSTGILLAAEGTNEAVETGFLQTRAFIEASERRFTRFSPDSELSQLNRSAGRWFQASAEMFEVISLAARFHEQTLGLFDPSMLNALERAGYDRSIEIVQAQDAPAARDTDPFAEPAFSEIELDVEGQRIRLPRGLRIDLGGIAKGWIGEQAALRLAQWSAACAVDAGGDAFMIGLPAGETGWRVTLENPANPEQDLTVLKLKPGAVATSAVTKRRWQQGGQTRHHLIDPRTRQPAGTEWLSVTVIAPHAAEAEVYAKSLLIAGWRGADQVAHTAPGLEYLVVDQNQQLWGSKHTREVLDV